jgi:hypothetical protein
MVPKLFKGREAKRTFFEKLINIGLVHKAKNTRTDNLPWLRELKIELQQLPCWVRLVPVGHHGLPFEFLANRRANPTNKKP